MAYYPILVVPALASRLTYVKPFATKKNTSGPRGPESHSDAARGREGGRRHRYRHRRHPLGAFP